jgi:hypothetical protein
MVLLRPDSEAKPGNHRFRNKIIKDRQKWRPYGPGSDRSTRDRQKSHIHVRCKAFPGDLAKRTQIKYKSSTNLTNKQHQVTLDPPSSRSDAADPENYDQDARRGIDLGHQGGAIYHFSGHFTVELVSTKNNTFPFPVVARSIMLMQFTWEKNTNENAARYKPLQCIGMNQIEVDFYRFFGRIGRSIRAGPIGPPFLAILDDFRSKSMISRFRFRVCARDYHRSERAHVIFADLWAIDHNDSKPKP